MYHINGLIFGYDVETTGALVLMDRYRDDPAFQLEIPAGATEFTLPGTYSERNPQTNEGGPLAFAVDILTQPSNYTCSFFGATMSSMQSSNYTLEIVCDYEGMFSFLSIFIIYQFENCDVFGVMLWKIEKEAKRLSRKRCCDTTPDRCQEGSRPTILFRIVSKCFVFFQIEG